MSIDIPKGWKLVPVKPTPKMLAAAAAAMSPGKRPTPRQVSNRLKHRIRYQAMLEAAPETPGIEIVPMEKEH